MTDLHPRVAEALDAVTAERLVALLQELVRIPSITGTAAESEAQHVLAARLRASGADVDLWSADLDALAADPAFPGTEAPRTEAWGLVGTFGDADGPVLVLNGHIDVVPPGDLEQWPDDPFSGLVRDGRVHGRGSCDMKAGLVAALVAAQALREARVPLRGRVQLQSVVSEEDGGLGALLTLRRDHRGDAAVVTEPTGLALVPAAAGALTFRLTVPGRAAHGSTRYEGVDAVEKYLLVHQALRRLEARRNEARHPLMSRYEIPYALSVGTVRAGDWASSVPDRLVAEGRLGVAIGEPVEDARRDLEQAVAEVCADDPWLVEHPVAVEWSGGQFAPGELPEGSPLLEQVARAHQRVAGAAPDVHGVPYGSDLRLLSGIGGIPTLHYGPGDIRLAHGPGESVPVDEVVTTARALVLVAVEVCGIG